MEGLRYEGEGMTAIHFNPYIAAARSQLSLAEEIVICIIIPLCPSRAMGNPHGSIYTICT